MSDNNEINNIYTAEELRSIQMVELDILTKVAQVCEKHNLTYFLDSGTALGAVRHDGFIPWDDDVDIGMPRKDYEKFLEIGQSELGDEYFLQNYITDPGCPFLFSKVRKSGTSFVEWSKKTMDMHHGIYIDIFPYDVLPKNNPDEFIDRCNQKTEWFFRLFIPETTKPKEVNLKWKAKNAVKKLMYKIASRYDKKKIADDINEFAKKFDDSLNENSVLFCPFFLGDYKFRYSTLMPVKRHVFESGNFNIPADVDCFLKELYGDYMQLPPEEERTGHRPYLIDLDKEYHL